MVTMPPYSPSVRWYACWIHHLMSGASDTESICRANIDCVIAERDFARTSIQDQHGKDLVLSIAIEGGAKKLKTKDALSNLKLSEHGNWRKNHLGALEAVYGKSPFFDHLFNELKNVYNNLNINTLSDFNFNIHKALSAFLKNNISLGSLNNLWGGNVVLSERGREIATLINPRGSIIDPLMKIGPETILALPRIV